MSNGKCVFILMNNKKCEVEHYCIITQLHFENLWQVACRQTFVTKIGQQLNYPNCYLLSSFPFKQNLILTPGQHKTRYATCPMPNSTSIRHIHIYLVLCFCLKTQNLPNQDQLALYNAYNITHPMICTHHLLKNSYLVFQSHLTKQN